MKEPIRPNVGGAERFTFRSEQQPTQRALVVVPVTAITATTAGTAQVLLTVNAGEFFQIGGIAVCNTNASTAYEYSLHIVPSGGSAGTGNLLQNGNSIPAKATEYIGRADGILADAGSTIEVWASAASELNITLWGHRITGGEAFG